MAMNALSVALISIATSIVAAAGTAWALRRDHDPVPPSGNDAIALEVANLEKDLQRLREEMVRPATGSTPVDAGAERTAQATMTDEQFAAHMLRYTHRTNTDAPADQLAAAAARGPGFDAKRAWEELRGTTFWTKGDAWRRLHKDGQLDAVIAQFEAAAKANPNDVDIQMQLANAYMSNLQLEPSKGPDLGVKADAQYDKVLALDENHWEARFGKAVSYSFWPAFTGKPKEAIVHFERLVAQQETMPVAEGQAETYLFLGNLLDQNGQSERAKEIWRKGVSRHPSHRELRRRLGN
jgi:tetratricopeptide (TPR) repeat protein